MGAASGVRETDHVSAVLSAMVSPVLSCSYVGQPEAASTRGYFLALVDVFTRAPTYPCHLPSMLNLILYKTADPNQVIRKSGTANPTERICTWPYTIHSYVSLCHTFVLGCTDIPAVQLLQLIEERFFLASIVADYRVSITSALPTMYRQSQQILSQRLAEDHPALAYELLTEVTRRADRAPKVRHDPSSDPSSGHCSPLV